ncbi:MAG: hypothetical protein VKQ33_12040 [Candidatus Sericytochromatia bacterium]|nr:hypothetical protein [Candidatus Sericytochromatia bacterium]
MNPRQLMGLAGGFLLVYVVITLTNRPAVTLPEASPGGASAVGGAPHVAGHPVADERIRGFTLMPPAGDAVDGAEGLARLPALAATGARWVALRPVVTQPTGTAAEVPAASATPVDLEAWRRVVQAAHAAGLAVMLRPLVAAADGTRREAIAPPDAATWLATWERALDPWLALARDEQVELVCLGSNLTQLQGDPAWRGVVTRARTVYPGKLTYASSVEADAFQAVGWWDALDYVGLDAFFPLSTEAEPNGEALRQGWRNVAARLTAWRTGQASPPVLFTSVGMPRQAGGAASPAQPDATGLSDEQLPARAAEALFATVWGQPWFAGLFWHTWSGGGVAHAPYRTADTPTAEVLSTQFRAGEGPRAAR